MTQAEGDRGEAETGIEKRGGGGGERAGLKKGAIVNESRVALRERWRMRVSDYEHGSRTCSELSTQLFRAECTL